MRRIEYPGITNAFWNDPYVLVTFPRFFAYRWPIFTRQTMFPSNSFHPWTLIAWATNRLNTPSFTQTRVTSSSMPLPTQFPDVQGNSVFFGDYSGLAVANTAMPLWMDTRSLDLFVCPASGPPTVCTATEPNGRVANDQDVFTAQL